MEWAIAEIGVNVQNIKPAANVDIMAITFLEHVQLVDVPIKNQNHKKKRKKNKFQLKRLKKIK